jgi:hypothetical protein
MRENSKLVSEIQGLIKQLGREDLLQLKQQASAMIYNQTVEEINKELKPQPNRSEDSEPQETQPRAKMSPLIQIDQSDNRMYVYISTEKNERVFFTIEEMAKMLNVCESASQVKKIPHNLYRWLEKERSDFLIETAISSPSDPHMKELCLTILEEWGE